MDSEEKYIHWVKIATRDLNTIDTLYKGGHWLETAFYCQQAIEKLVKGIYIIYIDDNIPYIHDIGAIVNKFVDKLSVPVSKEIFDFFDELSAYYIKTRYADYKDTMFKTLNKEKTKTLLTKTKEVFSWLLTLKK